MSKTKIAKNTFQQGDVIARRVDKIPEGLKTEQKNKLILAHGEVTGHYHGIEAGGATLTEEREGSRFMSLDKSAPLQHQEHGHIAVGEGIWEVGRVQEFDYFSQMVRAVAD